MTYTPTEQANIDAIYRFMEAEAVQDWDTVYQFIAPDCVNYSPTGVVRGHEEMHRFDAAMFAGLQSWRRTILDIVADGDAVVFRWRGPGTHSAEWAGLSASANRVEFHGTSTVETKHGLARRIWIDMDMASVMRQMAPQETNQ